MKKLSQQERALFGECPVCHAAHGQSCMADDGAGPVDYGAHRRRIQLAPSEVLEYGEAGTHYKYYVDGLEAVKVAGPEWSPETRLMLIMATSLLMQTMANKGVPYGTPGFPNLQTLLEIGGTPADELEAMRGMLMQSIDELLLPYFRDGKLPDVPSHIEEAAKQQNEFQVGLIFGAELAKGVKEAKAKGLSTPLEDEILELLEEAMALGKEMGGDMAKLLLKLDEKRWPGASEFKNIVITAATLAGIKLH